MEANLDSYASILASLVAIIFAVLSWLGSRSSKQYSNTALRALEAANSKNVVSQLSRIAQIGNECLEEIKFIEFEHQDGPPRTIAMNLCAKVSNFVTSIQSTHLDLEPESLALYFREIENTISEMETYGSEDITPKSQVRKLKSQVSNLLKSVSVALNNETFKNVAPDNQGKPKSSGKVPS